MSEHNHKIGMNGKQPKDKPPKQIFHLSAHEVMCGCGRYYVFSGVPDCEKHCKCGRTLRYKDGKATIESVDAETL